MSRRARRLSNWRVERSPSDAYISSNRSCARMSWQRWPFCKAFNRSPQASPVLPTPVVPTNTRFSCLATKSSSAKVRICLRFTPGWRGQGSVSSDQRSVRLALRMCHSRALSCLSCHCARNELRVRGLRFLCGAQLFVVDTEHAPQLEILQQLFQFFSHLDHREPAVRSQDRSEGD